MVKILVTGAAGGIGSTLSFRLASKGFDLILVDNLRNGYRENLLIGGEKYGRFFEIDINSKDFDDLVKKERPEYILHLAAITSLPDCESNFTECIRVNVEGTASVLKSASKYGTKRVIFTSTSAVYENTPFDIMGYNETDPINPKLIYSLSKKMAEEVCLSFFTNYGLDVLIFRLFNVFGPRQDIHRKHPPVINYITKKFLENDIPILHSDGSQVRDYIHIDDVVDLFEKSLDCNTDSNRIFNVSSGTLTSLTQIVSSIEKVFDNKIGTPIYRESTKLWDAYPELFDGKFPLEKSVVEKETNKKSLGNNHLASKHFHWSPNQDISGLIEETAKIICSKNKNKL